MPHGDDRYASFQDLLELVPQAVLIVDIERDIVVEANPAAAKLFKFEREELVGANFTAINPEQPDGSDPVVGHADRLDRMRRGESFHFRWYMRDKELRRIPVQIFVTPLRERGLFATFVDDMSQEAMLLATNDRYQAVADATTDVVGMADGEGNVQYLNPAGRRILGCEGVDISMRKMSDFHPPEAAKKLMAHCVPAAVQHGVWEGETDFLTDSGEVLKLHQVLIAHPSPTGGIEFFSTLARDLSAIRHAAEERRKLEARVQQAQKLESLGVLAGGIAHDFNNLLAAILANVSFALSQMPAGHDLRPALEDVESAGVQAAALARQMLEYSGRSSFRVESVDVSRTVHDLMHLLEASISKNATVELRFPDDLPAVAANVSQLRQVVMNLVTNGSDALGGEAGILSLSATTLDVDDNLLSGYIHDGIDAGRYVCLEVSDTGSGIPAQSVPKIFDPFFSTKITGRGLGLASVLGIVRSHRGAISVTSEVDHGTTVKLLLPIHRDPVEAREASESDAATWRGTGTVLVVDDEAPVRRVARRILSGAGFRVLEAADGAEAVDLFAREAASIELVLLDLTMPRRTGLQALAELRRIKADVKVVLSSGYNPSSNVELSQEVAEPFLSKPYSVEQLMSAVRRQLGGTPE